MDNTKHDDVVVELDMTGDSVLTVSKQVGNQFPSIRPELYTGYDNLVKYIRELQLLGLLLPEEVLRIRAEIRTRIINDLKVIGRNVK